MSRINRDELLKQAAAARELAYAPYSHYAVGAAVLTKSGKVYTGCNIENAAYSMCNCGERTAIFKAVSEGEREFAALAVVTENGGSPCGACRQVFYEFASADTLVIVSDTKGNRQEYTIGELLVEGFGPSKLPH